MRRAVIALAALLGASPAAAEPAREIAGEAWGTAAALLASVEQAIPLVQTRKEIEVDWGEAVETVESDLRVSLLVLDLGPATDVSPRQALHLAMFNDISEFGTAWSVTPIAAVWAFHSATRRGPGLYDVAAEVFARPTEGCFIHHATLRVDARALSAAVREARGLGEFESRRLRHPVEIETLLGECAH